ncbi:MAG: hemolysin family protein [Pseudomonadota bacterium]
MELLILSFLIVLNGLFAMSEMSVVSSRKTRLQQWADEGRPGAMAALALANEPSMFLSTIQVGITVIGITSGAFGEATLATELSDWLSQWSWLDPYSDGLALTIVVAGITLASLIIGELVPKRLALLNPEAIASTVAKPMSVLSRIAYPLVRMLSLATEGVLKLFGVRASVEPLVTEEEINVLMEQGAEAGIFEEHEQELVARALRLDQIKVAGIMTPRADIVYLNLEDPPEANIRWIVENSHSRYPVVKGVLDRVEGITLARNLLADAITGKPIDLRAHLSKPLYVPASISAMEAVEQFKKYRQTAALVISEHGDIRGLVTLNDVMGALVGDIATVEDQSERDIIKRDESSWLLDGGVSLERLKTDLGIEEQLPGEDEETFHTVGGLIMHQLGRVPAVADRFDWNGWRFEVVDMDKQRVDKVLASKLPEPGEKS